MATDPLKPRKLKRMRYKCSYHITSLYPFKLLLCVSICLMDSDKCADLFSFIDKISDWDNFLLTDELEAQFLNY